MQLNGIKASVVGLYSIRPNKHDIYQQADNVLGSVDKPTQPNQQWVADFTYLKTGEGWYYFSMILDRYSRKLVGWSFSKDRSTEFTKSSLIMALESEKPEGGLIFHTDQGIEYVSHKFQNKLREENLRPSMSRKGRCLDNAMVESFFHTMKTGMFNLKKYKTMTSVKKIYCRLSSFIIKKDYTHLLGICRLKSLLSKQPECPLYGCKISLLTPPRFIQ